MKRKTKFRSLLSNLFVVCLCLSVCAGSLWLFFTDLNSSSSRTDKAEVATITFKYRIAQRKYDDRVVWERLQQHSPLYNGDTIRTADLALATIHLGGGADIDISENTMVQIFVSKDGKVKLSVNGGEVSVDTTNASAPLELEMSNGVVVSLETGSKISAKVNETETSEIKLTSGNATLVQSNSEEETDAEQTPLVAGTSFKVREDGTVSKNPITVTSVKGNQRVLIFDDKKEEATVPIEWTPVANKSSVSKVARVVVETSDKKDFSEIRNTYIAESENKIDIPAEDGSLYWRAYIEDDKDDAVEGKLIFETVPAVFLTSPGKNDVYNYHSEKPAVNFSWKGNDYSSKYKIEISKNNDMKNPEVTREVSSQNITLDDLDDGTFYWRVIPYYEIEKIGWRVPTEVRSFTISKQEKISPAKLTVPADGKKFTYTEKTFDADFVWKGEKAGEDFTLQISQDEDFKNVIVDEKIKSKSYHQKFSVYDFPNGDYYWRVKQDDNLVSETRKFTVEEYVPEPSKILLPEDGYAIEASDIKSVNFMWKISPDMEKKYADEKTKIQFSKKEDFSEIEFEKDVSSSSLKNVNLPVGKYYWRVKKGRSGTDSRTLFVKGKLQSPSVTSLKADSKITLDENKDFVIEWAKIPEADFYRVKILDVDSKRVLKEIPETTSTRVTFPTKSLSKNEKRFAVQVQAFVKESKLTAARESDVSEIKFTARGTSSTKLAKPVITSPTERLLDEKFFRKNRTITFAWKKVPDATDYNFTLYQKMPNGTLKKVYESKNQKGTQVKIKDLTILDIGTFQCQVEAVNRAKDGFVYQKGDMAKEDFRISFLRTRKVEIVDPGEMYGD